MSEDGWFDYRTLTKAQIEYAIAHIDGSKFPKNLTNARDALLARNSGLSPEPKSALDEETDARYSRWAGRLLGSIVTLYAALGLAHNDVMILYWSRIQGVVIVELRGYAAWMGGLALILLAAIPFLGGLDDSDDAKGLTMRPPFKYVFWIATTLVLVAVVASQWAKSRGYALSR